MSAVLQDAPAADDARATPRWLVPSAVAAAIAVLYLAVGIGDHSLWSPTEPAVAGVVWNMANGSSLAVPRINEMAYLEKPPLYYWLSLLSVKAFGLSAPALRLPSAFLGLGSLLALGVAVRRRYGADAALLAVPLAASLPWVWLASHRATTDAGVLFFSFSAYAILVHGLEETPGPSRRPRGHDLALGGVVALSFLVKNLFVPFVVLLPVTVTLTLLRRWRSLATIWAAFGAGVLLVALPWALLLRAEGGWPYVKVALVDNTVGRFLDLGRSVEIDRFVMNDARAVERKGTFFYVPSLVLITLPWTAVVVPALWRAARDARRAALRTFLVAGSASVVLGLTASASKAAGYLLPLCFFLGLAAAEWSRDRAARDGALLLGHARVVAPLVALAVVVLAGIARTPAATAAALAALLLAVASFRLPRRHDLLPLAAAVVLLAEAAAVAASVPVVEKAKSSAPFFADVLREARDREVVTFLREDRRLPLINFYLRRRVTVLPGEKEVREALLGPAPVAAIVPVASGPRLRDALPGARLRFVGGEPGRHDLLLVLNDPPVAARPGP